MNKYLEKIAGSDSNKDTAKIIAMDAAGSQVGTGVGAIAGAAYAINKHKDPIAKIGPNRIGALNSAPKTKFNTSAIGSKILSAKAKLGNSRAGRFLAAGGAATSLGALIGSHVGGGLGLAAGVHSIKKDK